MSMEKEQKLLKQALAELGINVPVLATRMVGNKLQIFLYGGAKVIYPSSAAGRTPGRIAKIYASGERADLPAEPEAAEPAKRPRKTTRSKKS